jgi:putative ABC transport system permease protein
MKYLHLIWAELFRRKTRTILTLLSILAAFLLFGLLNGVRESFNEAGKSAAGAERLQVGSRLSFIQALPMALNQRIAQVEGVDAVTYANWFGGAYQDPRNQLFTFAVAPNYLDLYPEVEVDPKQREAFANTRTGVLVGHTLMQRFGWKVGQKIPLQSTIFPNRDGSKNWDFDIVGTMRSTDPKNAWYDQMLLLQWKYFDESTPYNQGQAGWYVVRVDDPANADRVAKAIDALSANSANETKTMTEQAATQSWMKQMADIGLIVTSIMGAVFFTLLLLRQHHGPGGARADPRTGGAQDHRLQGWQRTRAGAGRIDPAAADRRRAGSRAGSGDRADSRREVGRHVQRDDQRRHLAARPGDDGRDRAAGRRPARNAGDAPEHRRRAGGTMNAEARGAVAFAPFEKGGHGGFAFHLMKIKSKSPSVPLLRRGKKSLSALLPRRGRKSMFVRLDLSRESLP